MSTTQIPEPAGTTRCKQCARDVPDQPGYVTWCECGWNLKPLVTREPSGLLDRLYVSLGEQRGREMFETLRQVPDLRARWTLSRLLVYGLSVAVHLGTLLVLAAGGWLTFRGHGLVRILGLILVALAAVLRPRFGKMPEGLEPLETFPQLHRLVQRVAEAVGTTAPHGIVVNEDFNSSVKRCGLQQRKVLFLGLPLFSILTPDEKVALLGHELGHFANGDTTQGLLAGMTLQTLEQWRRVLRPDSMQQLRRFRSIAHLVSDLATHFLFRALSVIPWTLITAFSHLTWDDKQRAEYLADALGAKASGTKAFLSTLDKSNLGPVYQLAIQKVTINRSSANVLDELAARVAAIPARETERLRRVSEMEGSRLDATHPPTAFRIGLLRQREALQPLVQLGVGEHSALCKELQPAARRVHERLVDQYRRSLYR
jgi:Zn-dependent protease with chaperone function